MPFGKYPERVKPFRKWAQERVDKATMNDKATSFRRSSRGLRRRRRLRKKRTGD